MSPISSLIVPWTKMKCKEAKFFFKHMAVLGKDKQNLVFKNWEHKKFNKTHKNENRIVQKRNQENPGRERFILKH